LIADQPINRSTDQPISRSPIGRSGDRAIGRFSDYPIVRFDRPWLDRAITRFLGGQVVKKVGGQDLTPIETFEIRSDYLGIVRRIDVWMPPGFRARGPRRYPVLYLNDGQNLFDSARAFAGNTWRVAETATRLVQGARIPPILIVGIDHGAERRGREYLPVKDDRNPWASEPLGRRYAHFVTRELMPEIARRYSIARGAANTAFGGSSYGAVAALYTSILTPGVFGRLLLESPSLYVGGGFLLRRARAATRWPARVYLGVGTAETQRSDWNEETVANVRQLERTLRAAGLGPRRLRVVVEQGGSHSEHAWAARLPGALDFLFRTHLKPKA
jgi:predicted alpha/beta superfamily hydrolase